MFLCAVIFIFSGAMLGAIEVSLFDDLKKDE